MRVMRRTVLMLSCLLLPVLAYTRIGVVRRRQRFVRRSLCPGVTVEASSPVLIEKTRTAVTDSTGLCG